MKFLHVGDFDCAGVAWHHRCALIGQGHECRTIFKRPTYVGHRADHWLGEAHPGFTDATAIEWLDWADRVFVHVGYEVDFARTDTHEVKELLPYQNKMILWANGSYGVRRCRDEYRQRYAAFRGVATNHDVAAGLNFTWMPACIEDMADAGQRMWVYEESVEKTLGHPWSDRALKNVDDARAAAEDAHWAYHDFMGRPHGLSLRLRSTCRAVFDHWQGYFGLTTMEATAMGQPVVLGANAEAMAALAAWGAPDPPWRRATNRAELAALLLSWGGPGMADEGAALRRWHETYFTNAIKIRRFLEWLVAS